MTEKKRVTMTLGDQVTVEMDMCPDENCVLAAGHPPGRHEDRRATMLACPHNVPNFGPECPICDVASVQLGGKLRYELYGDPRYTFQPSGSIVARIREAIEAEMVRQRPELYGEKLRLLLSADGEYGEMAEVADMDGIAAAAIKAILS